MPLANVDNNTIFVIAEDDDGHFRLIEKCLEEARLSNQIYRFTNGENLLRFFNSSISREKILRKDMNCILILDLRMPKKTGFEVLRYMQEQDLISDIPVIVHSTSDCPHTAKICLDLGAAAFVPKPTSQTLIDKIYELSSIINK